MVPIALLVSFLRFLVYVIIGALLFLFAVWFYLRPYRVDVSVPGPKRHPVWGMSFGDTELLEDGFSWDSWDKWPSTNLTISRKFAYRTWGAPSLNIGFGGAFFCIVNPECLQHVLRDNFDNYIKGKVARGCLQEIFGKGVFTADGDTWKLHRKVIVALMSKEMLRNNVSIMVKKLDQVSGILEKAADTEKEIDFQDLCMRLTLDCFVDMGFGVQLDTLGNQSEHIAFLDAFRDLQLCCHERFNDLLWEIRKAFCLGKREHKIRECAKILNDFAETIILATRKSNDPRRSDLISRFLRHVELNKEQPPTNQELRDMVMNFSLAGRDGTASTMSWAMYELTKHPVVSDRIREEVELVCGKNDYTYENLSKLNYTHAVVMETLRLHPPVPDDFKFAVKNDILPDGTRIPEGSLIMYSPYTINHSEKVWGPDADEFKPERFLECGEPSAFVFPTFNAGPRICPGKQLALLEVKLALAYLLPRFDFVDEQCHSGDYFWTLVMVMEGGFPIRVKRR